MKIPASVVACMISASVLSGCVQTRAEHGAVVGGVTGAAIGGLASGSVGGAVVGGAIGAGTGYVVGKHSYSCWKTGIFGNRYRGLCWR